jgi:hypothetical protein
MEPSRITPAAAKHKIDRGERVFFVDARNEKAWANPIRSYPEQDEFRLSRSSFRVIRCRGIS